jgi:hypothetical protein
MSELKPININDKGTELNYNDKATDLNSPDRVEAEISNFKSKNHIRNQVTSLDVLNSGRGTP